MAAFETKSLASLTDALETLGSGLRQVFEAIDWQRDGLDSRHWSQLRAKMTEFQSLSVLVEARRARLEPEAAQTLKPWLDRLIHSVAVRALQAEARLAEIQHKQREIPLFGRELFTQALHRLDRLVQQVEATSSEPERDRLVLERARHERKDLLELIHRAPNIPDFTQAARRRPQRAAA
jgi:hypothetical protein